MLQTKILIQQSGLGDRCELKTPFVDAEVAVPRSDSELKTVGQVCTQWKFVSPSALREPSNLHSRLPTSLVRVHRH